MSIKDKVMNMVTAHPHLVMFGIGLAVSLVIGTVIGLIDHNQAFGSGGSGRKSGSGGSQ